MNKFTKFNRDDFEYSGGYLMYEGDCGDFAQYYDNSESTHPTRRGTQRSRFIARFKYSGRDKARFLSFLIKNFSVEQYFAAYDAKHSPATILEAKGYVSATVRRSMKDHGYTVFNRHTYRDHFENFVSTSGDCAEFWQSKDDEAAQILAAY